VATKATRSTAGSKSIGTGEDDGSSSCINYKAMIEYCPDKIVPYFNDIHPQLKAARPAKTGLRSIKH
jgi:hypothetical protein